MLSLYGELVIDSIDKEGIFIDLSKSFDSVWHFKQPHSLLQIGITNRVVSWFQSYLCNRSHYVCKVKSSE